MKISLKSIINAIMLEHIVLLTAAVPFVAWVFLKGFFSISFQSSLIVGIVAGIGFAVVIYPQWFIKFINLVIYRFKGSPINTTPRSSDMLLLLGTYFFVWACYGLSGVMLAKAIGIRAPVDLIFTGFVTAWLVGFVSFITPGGFGVREAMLLLLLRGQADTPQIVAFAFIARVFWTIVELGISSLSIFWVNQIKTAPRQNKFEN
jgi:uncharacterized membrane protein YbhN (UPF0104 family)